MIKFPKISKEDLNKLQRKQADKYDAVIVLGAVMKWNGRKNKWEFPAIIKSYSGKLVMGEARALAARIVEYLTKIILVTGGSDKNPRTGKMDSRANQLAKLMVEKYDMLKEKVIVIGKTNSGHTSGNVENVIEYFEKNPKILKLKQVGIICPDFQKRRAKIMFDSASYFRENGIKLDWLSVENILTKIDSRYKKWIEEIYASPEAEVNTRMEKQGIKDFIADKYNVSPR